MKHTHILIPVEVIDKLINELNAERKSPFAYSKGIQSGKATILGLLKSGLGVSLNLTDEYIDKMVDIKAPKVIQVGNEYHGVEKAQSYRAGYKQAIKDIT